MTPFHAAAFAIKGAGLLMRGISSMKQHNQPVQQIQSAGPQGTRQAPGRPNVSNAPSFAEVFQQQNGATGNADKLANTMAKRLVKLTHRPMRTEQMNNFVQEARAAFTDMMEGKSTSPAIDNLKRTLKGRLDLNDNQVTHLVSQMGELAKSPQAQNHFLATNGESRQLV